jgi:DNA-binding MarR family transcriptional regulator
VVSADLDGDRLTLEQQVCFTLAVAAREVVSLYRPLLEPLGLTHPQYLVMVTLWQTPQPASIRQLSTLLKLEAPTLSPLLKRLEAAGLVQRHRDPIDERSLQITLTDRGWNLRASAQQVPAAIIQRLGMSIEELETLQNILTDVIQHAKTPVQPTPSQPRPDDVAAGAASAHPNNTGSSEDRCR